MATAALTYTDHIKQYLNSQAAAIVPKGSFDDDNLVTALDNCIAASKADAPLDLTAKCMFCMSIPRNPVSLSSCGHVSCETCIMTHLVIGPALEPPNPFAKACPLCRMPFTYTDLLKYSQWPLFAKQVWCLTQIKCETCNFESNPPDMIKHELRMCPNRKVKCPGCSVAGNVDFVAEHAMQCEDVTVNCITCGHVIHIVNKDRHNCENLLKMLRSSDNGRIILPRGPKGAVVRRAAVTGDDLELVFGDGRLRRASTSASQGEHSYPTPQADTDFDTPSLHGPLDWPSALATNQTTPPQSGRPRTREELVHQASIVASALRRRGLNDDN
jgi:hypothetical protein